MILMPEGAMGCFFRAYDLAVEQPAKEMPTWMRSRFKMSHRARGSGETPH